MKKLTKIKLINWHGFYNETIKIKGSVLLMGNNGSGKSTLIDALYYLISGGDDSKFNIAANENASRTIETYMRGKLGMENKQYLRNDKNLISHIALEYYDDVSCQYFVIGVVLEIVENSPVSSKKFYIIENKQITEELFVISDDDKVSYIDYDDISTKYKGQIRSLGKSKKERKRNIKQALNVENDKYFELLSRGIAFKPIADVSQFVYDFLMPKKDIDLDKLKNNVREFNQLQKQIEASVKKKESLGEIYKQGEKYIGCKKEIKLLEYSILKKDIERISLSLDNLNKNLKADKLKLQDCQMEFNAIKTQIDGVKNDISILKQSGDYILMQSIDLEISNLKHQLKTVKTAINEFERMLNSESEVSKALDLKTDFKKYTNIKDFSKLQEDAGDYADKLNDKGDYITRNIGKAHDEKRIKLEELEKKSKEKELLEKGIPQYKYEVSKLIELMKNRLPNGVVVVPFCELIEIVENEEEWRNAVEGYLNTRKFDLFVPQEYYDEALQVYEQNKKQFKIHGVGLVNLAKLEDVLVKENSLAEKVDCKNEYARKYANYLLGDLICVENELELKRYSSSITKTVMVYKNKAARQTRPEVYAKPFIGRNSIKVRIGILSEEIDVLGDELVEIDNNTSYFVKLKQIYKKSEISKIQETKNIWNEYDIYYEQLQKQIDKKNELNKKQGIFIQVEVAEKKQQELENQASELSQQCEKFVGMVSVGQDKIFSTENTLATEIEKESQYKNDVEIAFLIDEFVFKEENTKVSELKERMSSVTKQANGLNATIPYLMSEYIDEYNFDAVANMDNYALFIDEYTYAVKENLEQYKKKIQDAKKDVELSFRNSYIADIRKYIKDEQNNIKKLNSVLANNAFGSSGEVYKFEVSASKDRNFKLYYDLFMGHEDYEIRDLFTEDLSDQNKELMQQLLFRLSADTTDSKQEKLIKQYTDYRSFMSYDIKVTNQNGDVSYFSKINKEKSGGETQTPFYVIIAASFDQIINNSYGQKSPGCLVMLDEAFSNMDLQRIDSMMQYYKSLKIQPIIAVPSQRSHDIFPYVETAITIVKAANGRIIPQSHIAKEN